MNEKWPFHDESTGANIHEAMFYGFGDSGYIAGNFCGYLSRESAIKDISEGADDVSWIGTKPEDLGNEAITVLSGREYIDRLKVIQDGDDLGITIYGKWSE